MPGRFAMWTPGWLNITLSQLTRGKPWRVAGGLHVGVSTLQVSLAILAPDLLVSLSAVLVSVDRQLAPGQIDGQCAA